MADEQTTTVQDTTVQETSILGSGASENQIENLLNILEEKSIWQRYGF